MTASACEAAAGARRLQVAVGGASGGREGGGKGSERGGRGGGRSCAMQQQEAAGERPCWGASLAEVQRRGSAGGGATDVVAMVT